MIWGVIFWEFVQTEDTCHFVYYQLQNFFSDEEETLQRRHNFLRILGERTLKSGLGNSS